MFGPIAQSERVRSCAGGTGGGMRKTLNVSTDGCCRMLGLYSCMRPPQLTIPRYKGIKAEVGCVHRYAFMGRQQLLR